MFSYSVMNVIKFFFTDLEYLVLVKFEPVKSAEPPKKLFIFSKRTLDYFAKIFL